MKFKNYARLCVSLYFLISFVASLEEEEIETEGENETNTTDYDNDTSLLTSLVLNSLSPSPNEQTEGWEEEGKSQGDTSDEKNKPFIPVIPELTSLYVQRTRKLCDRRRSCLCLCAGSRTPHDGSPCPDWSLYVEEVCLLVVRCNPTALTVYTVLHSMVYP